MAGDLYFWSLVWCLVWRSFLVTELPFSGSLQVFLYYFVSVNSVGDYHLKRNQTKRGSSSACVAQGTFLLIFLVTLQFFAQLLFLVLDMPKLLQTTFYVLFFYWKHYLIFPYVFFIIVSIFCSIFPLWHTSHLIFICSDTFRSMKPCRPGDCLIRVPLQVKWHLMIT